MGRGLKRQESNKLEMHCHEVASRISRHMLMPAGVGTSVEAYVQGYAHACRRLVRRSRHMCRHTLMPVSVQYGGQAYVHAKVHGCIRAQASRHEHGCAGEGKPAWRALSCSWAAIIMVNGGPPLFGWFSQDSGCYSNG